MLPPDQILRKIVQLFLILPIIGWGTAPFAAPFTRASVDLEDLEESLNLPTTSKAEQLMARALPKVERTLARQGMQLGQPVFMRIFKLSKELEVWLLSRGEYRLFKTYPICSYSGYIGPKLVEGDWQSPEGFYTVSAEQMNPSSRFHLSFNIGYPNTVDIARNCTGSAIMVHGKCLSQGCFAMGNAQIEEIYLLAHEAFLQGQERFSIHIFPFRMTKDNLVKYRYSPWYDFWSNLAAGYNAFEQSRQVPVMTSDGGRYIIEVVGKDQQKQQGVVIREMTVRQNMRKNQFR